MATVLNRSTKQLILSANTPDYPVGQWIIDPDLSAVAGQPSRYWSISGDTVSLLNQAGRDAVDAAILNATRDATAAVFDAVEDIQRAFALIVLDEVNALRGWLAGFKTATAAAASLAALKTSVAALPDTPDRSMAQLKTALRAKLGT